MSNTYCADDRTLGIKSIWQLYDKLQWEVALFNEVPQEIRLDNNYSSALLAPDRRIYIAINAFNTSLALVDWLYHILKDDEQLTDNAIKYFGKFELKKDKDFLAFLRDKYYLINVSHQISNAFKHSYLREKTFDPDFYLHVGDLYHIQGKDTYQRTIMCILKKDEEGNTIHIDKLLSQAVTWWGEVLSHVNPPNP